MRIGAVGQQYFRKFEIPCECGAMQCTSEHDTQRCIAVASARRVIYDGVRIRTRVEKFLYERHRIRRYCPWEAVGSEFHVAAIDGPEERCESLRICVIDIDMVVDEKR